MRYFKIEEFLRSATAREKGIDNTPTAEHTRNIKELVRDLLDPLREAWEIHCKDENLGNPALRVTSGYRGFRLNDAVGGSQTSAHCVGYAADIVPMNNEFHSFKEFCKRWFDKKKFDQVISEEENIQGVPRWIHIGIRNTKGKQRRQLLSMRGGQYTPMT